MVTSTHRKRIIRLGLFFVVATTFSLGLAFGLMLRDIWKSRPPLLKHAFPHGEIRIGVDASFPPFAVDDGQSVYGIDIDLGNALAQEIGLPVRFINIGFDALYDAVTIDQVDMVISALRVDPSRMADVRYTTHYFDAGLILVTSEGSPITMMEFMEGYRIAFEFGSIADAEVREWGKRIGRMQHQPYELPQYALDAVRLEQADAALVDATSFLLYQRDHPEWNTQHRYITHDVYAIAIRIDRLGTWEFVNHALNTLKKNGELDRIKSKWF